LFNTAQDFWKGLGSFWLHFENRADLEAFWDGMFEALKEAHRNLYKVSTGKFPAYSPDVWNHKYISIPLVWSGVEDNRINETNYFSLPDEYVGTFSIPELSGINTGQILEQGTDYSIVDCNKIYITNLSGLEHDTSYIESLQVDLYAENLYRIDPMIFNLVRKMADTENLITDQTPYYPFTYDGSDSDTLLLEKAKLIKYMTWAMFYLRLQKPSITNLKKIYNIIYNLPFAYEDGTASISGTSCTIGNYTYYISGGESWGIGDGASVNRFDPLTSGIELKDRISDPAEIISEFGNLGDAYSFILEVTPLTASVYDTDFISKYEEDFLDAAFNIKTTLI